MVGSSVTFVATADGSPAPTFQWRKNGLDIPGATDATLSFGGVTIADAAAYQVVATNSAGFAVSPDEVLVVETTPAGDTSIPPAIATQPAASQTGKVGGSISFSVSATGTPTPTFQWQKNGVDLAGATDATLTLPALTLNDNATYLAIASNSAGSVASNPAVLVVIEPTAPPPPPPTNVAPTILTQPSDIQTAWVGGSATFTVSASGVPAPTFQWLKNSVQIAGATDANLTLSFVTTSDSAKYSVIASNVAGAVTSDSAELAVTEVVSPPAPPPPPSAPTTSAPAIASQPVSTQTVKTGASASFTVIASGDPNPSYQWRKNGAKIAGATKATFSLSSVTSADAGTYMVLASNSAGTVASENATLIVHSAPVFKTQPLAQAVTVGVSTKFSVAVSAIPGAALQWFKDGSAISGATSSMLLLNSTSDADVGVYTVLATNAVGSTRSAEAPLAIAAPPIITKQPISQTVVAKSNVTLTVAASGSPAPTFQWKKNNSVISGATNSTLVLKGVNKSNAGDYSVEARNVAGWVASKRATLAVNNQTGRQTSDDEGIEPAPGGSSVAATGLVNLSVRANAGTGSDGLIVGFVIDGSSTKSVLVRGVGPTLRDFGVTGALSDPQLSLYSGSVVTASNDDWSAGDNAAQIAGTSVRVGAFSLADQTSDSALMATLENGAYTVQLSGKETESGVALVEVYDAATNGLGKLVNLSVRAYVGSGSDVPNVGFVVAGSTPRKIMIRAVGPTLGAFGVTDSIADPQLELFHGSTRIDQNDNWGGNTSLSATFAEVGAFGFADPASRDAVLVTTLDPGAYTVVVSGANGTKGVGLVEVYDVP
ncbi:MAG: immunoglobulin domain-containing protein [Opitutaceae bacterium]